MRLLVWASSYGQTAGGGPVLAPLLVAALAQRGHEIIVLTDRRPETLEAEEIRDDARILRPRFRRALAGDPRLAAEIRREVTAIKRQFRPDLGYIFSSGYGEFFHHLTSDMSPAPMVVSLHDRFPTAFYQADALVGRNLRSAAWVTACSAAVLATARFHIPALTPISSVIHNALPVPTRDVVPAHFDPPRLIFVGRLVRQKGVDILFAAIALLTARYPDLGVAIAGDGELRVELESQAAALGIAARTRFLGALDHAAIYDLMASASLIVMPSRIEPFGLVALEAALMARPIVAAAVDGLPEIVSHGETGLLVPSDDASALADAIATLLDRPAFARQLGETARSRALDRFGWDRFVDAHEALFQRIAAR